MPLTPEEKRAHRAAYMRVWRHKENNLEKHNTRTRAWKAQNPERRAYQAHKDNARRRGVVFILTFKEWMTIWRSSGKWEQRGRYKGQYVMARLRDQGSYAVGNVHVCTTEENLLERWRNRHGGNPLIQK